MRAVIAYVIALGFIVAGVVIGGGGVRHGIATGNNEDLAAGAIIGGLLSFIGIGIVFAARRSAKRRAEIDAGLISGVAMAHMLNDPGDDGGADAD